MSKNQRRRFSDEAVTPVSGAVLGLQADAPGRRYKSLLVAGAVKGNSKLSGMLALLRSGRWEGDVEAVNAVVAGQVKGNLTIAERLEIRKSARIGGSVRARTIAIADGAVVEGEIASTSDTPPIRFREKRKKDRQLRLSSRGFWPSLFRGMRTLLSKA